MKRSNPKKLVLNRERLRQLSGDELAAAVGGISRKLCGPSEGKLCHGGGPTAKCTNAGCPNTSNPCGSGATCDACETLPSG